MEIHLHPNEKSTNLPESYKRALTSAQEILIVSAYLTHWDPPAKLSSNCRHFRMIVGKDFGITKKDACRAVLKWLPSPQRANFRVADQIDGFHPKAVFWKDQEGNCHAIIGSSNLTGAAFSSNYEANIDVQISVQQYDAARIWIDRIAELSIPLSEDWLTKYEEAKPSRPPGRGKSEAVNSTTILPIRLPQPAGTKNAILERRATLDQFKRNQKGLISLFHDCASGKVKSSRFHKELTNYWGGDVGGRIQGWGWQVHGQFADAKELSGAYIKILDAEPTERDNIVVSEIDKLAKSGNSMRGSFLSEMLCLQFPESYPILNEPIKEFIESAKLRGARGLSQGAKYVDLAQRLRLALIQNQDHPAKNLVELDAVVWLQMRPQT